MKPDVDNLFKLPLAEFTAERNALASKLKKAGEADEAERVKALAKPSLSAWVANQLYWRDRKALDRLLAAGNQFRKAQAAQLAGRSAELRAPLDARRAALGELAKLASGILREAGHPPAPDTIRRITTTLEALATYAGNPDAPAVGRLTVDVDPPGFEALAALVPREGALGGRGSAASRVIPFNQPKPGSAPKRKAGSKDDARRIESERRAMHAAARKALHDAQRALAQATRAAEKARGEMKTAAARAREAEKARAVLETSLEKAASEADAARQEARRIASQAEEAAQAMDDAERAVAKAREMLKESSRPT